MTNSPAPRQDHAPAWLYAMLMIGGLIVAVTFTYVIWIRFEKMNQPRIPAASTSTGLPNWVPPSEVEIYNQQSKTEQEQENERLAQEWMMRLATYPKMPNDTTATALDIAWTTSVKTSFATATRNLLVWQNIAPIELENFFISYGTPNDTFRVGTVRNGPYAGWHYYYAFTPCDGMCFNAYGERLDFILKPDGTDGRWLGSSRTIPEEYRGESYYYTRYTDESDRLMPFAPNIQAPKPVEIPNEITISNGETLKTSDKGSWATFLFETSQETWKDTGLKYRNYAIFDTGECLVLVTEDHRIHGFSSRPYWGAAIPEGRYPEIHDVTPDKINWTGATPQKNYRSLNSGGCFISDCPRIAREEMLPKASDLIQVGRFKDGNDPVYIVKNIASSTITQSIYESWYFYDEGKDKPTIDEFVEQNPIPFFLWKDALGRYVIYSLSELAPLAECGKPVIYLYPEKPTTVSVRLPSFINVTVSEPTYPKQGWITLAHPDGTLVMPDGSKYGSLFWEGTGVGYETPTEGWLVKDGEQESFLKETLTKLGLNETESKEFMEFWLPLMQDAPYYRVSFIVSEWSKAAPLYVSPKPTTQIRIFMDWDKRSSPISIQAPQIETPKREGFTLVEWGGLLRK